MIPINMSYLLCGFLGTKIGKTPPITPNMALNKIMGKIEAPMIQDQSYLLTEILRTG